MKTVRLYNNPNMLGYMVEFEGRYYLFGPQLSELGTFQRVAEEIVSGSNPRHVSLPPQSLFHQRCVALCIEPIAVRQFPDEGELLADKLMESEK